MTTMTSTAVNACDAEIWLDKEGGTATNISGSTTVVTPSFTQPAGEFRTFSSHFPKRLQCPQDASFAVQSVYSTAADEAKDLVMDWFFNHNGESRTLSLYMPAKTAGADKYSGEFKLTDVTFPATAGEAAPTMISYTLVCDGAVTWSTAST